MVILTGASAELALIGTNCLRIADDVLPYEGNQGYQSVSDVVNFWLNHNNIPPSSLVTTELNGGDEVLDEYTGGNENTSVVLYTVNSEHDKPGGHVRFSDSIGGTNPNQIFWDFFIQLQSLMIRNQISLILSV